MTRSCFSVRNSYCFLQRLKIKSDLFSILADYSCVLCGKKYNVMRDLKRHIRNHEVKHVCEVCGKRCAPVFLKSLLEIIENCSSRFVSELVLFPGTEKGEIWSCT